LLRLIMCAKLRWWRRFKSHIHRSFVENRTSRNRRNRITSWWFVVSTFAGAFGGSLRETRLTAMLGYLIAIKPKEFSEFFGFSGKPLSVKLENRHEDGRSDILIETDKGLGVIEAKVGTQDPREQSIKYRARWTVLLTQFKVPRRLMITNKVSYFTWQKLADFLVLHQAKSTNPRIRFIAQDLCKYLEEHRMTKQKEMVEIYAREINETFTTDLFLKVGLYGCVYEKGSRMSEARYFAPHFGQKISKDHPGIKTGISYIARIEVQVIAETWKDLVNEIIEIKGKRWVKTHSPMIDQLKNHYNWKAAGTYVFLFLAEPKLVFNPPVNKEHLQKGKGWLSKRFLSFEELFEAWGC